MYGNVSPVQEAHSARREERFDKTILVLAPFPAELAPQIRIFRASTLPSPPRTNPTANRDAFSLRGGSRTRPDVKKAEARCRQPPHFGGLANFVRRRKKSFWPQPKVCVITSNGHISGGSGRRPARDAAASVAVTHRGTELRRPKVLHGAPSRG